MAEEIRLLFKGVSFMAEACHPSPLRVRVDQLIMVTICNQHF